MLAVVALMDIGMAGYLAVYAGGAPIVVAVACAAFSGGASTIAAFTFLVARSMVRSGTVTGDYSA